MSKKNTTYKQTAIGLIPSDWEISEISKQVISIHPQYKYQTNEYLYDGKYPIIDQGKKDIVGYSNEESNLIIDVPLVLFGDHTKIIKYIEKPFCVGADGNKLLKPKQSITPHFLYYSICYVSNRLPDLGYSRHYLELKNLSISIPSLIEQNKITKIISTWDDALKKTSSIISNLEVIKKNITINILSGKSKFNNPKATTKKDTLAKNNKIAKWEVKHISTVVKQVKNPVRVELTKEYRQLGIRSHTKGIFYKEPVSGLILGNKSVFYVEPNCFIVNIVFAWEHAIAKTTDNEIGFIVSHRFPMYKPLPDILDLDYLLYFFKSKKGKDLLGLASPGGAGRNKTLGQKEFLNLKIPVPPLEEQKKIATFLSILDRELELHKQKLQTLQLQKKGLMQQLLTGKIRVEI